MKKSISDLRKEREDKMSKMFSDLGIFFAFSNEQLVAGRKEGVTYVNAGAGMIIPKDNVEEFKKRHIQLFDEMEREYAENVPMDDYILYELNNHEAFYTWSVDEAYEAVKQYYPSCTIDDMNRVFKIESAKVNTEY
ncbi:MAG: hypothetical protein ACK5M3_05555 [Dysgonomonas sp.]